MRRVLRGAVEVPIVLVLLLGLGLTAAAHWAMRRSSVLALLLLLASCTSSSKSALHVDTTQAVDLHQIDDQVVTQTVRTGPETITTTVEEYATTANVPQDADSGPGTPFDASKLESSSPPILIRRTVTVDQRAPAVAETHAEAQQATQEHATAATETQATSEAHRAPAVGCMLGLGFWGAVLMAALAAAALLVLRLRGRLP